MNSIREVAKQAGVSTATVSRAFNTPELISQPTRQRVLEAAERLDYRPLRVHARKPAGRASSLPSVDGAFIGFQFFGANSYDLLSANPFYAPVLAGAQAEAAALGMHLLMDQTDRHQMSQDLPRMVREQAIAGMLLVGTADPGVLATFLERVPQIVLVDNRDPAHRHDCVLSDGLGGGLAASRHLFDLGHRRIAFLGNAAHVPTFRDRLRGFVCAHFERGHAADPELVVSAGAADLEALLTRLLGLPDPPTAFLAANDEHAYTLMQACRNLSIDIPEGLSLIGFDDIEFSARTWPPLTTVYAPKEQLGRLAVRQLHARLQARHSSPEALPPVTIEVPVSLIERQSCRALVP